MILLKILNKENNKLSDETIKSLEELGVVLYGIRKRLLAEGIIKIGSDGKVIFPEKKK
ncbi:hypothetical protein K9M47_01335 [Candidatus Gracilibacteria bacterium]|nr:hypothetical protein [Candidatus Gracilibacteria bacterium]